MRDRSRCYSICSAGSCTKVPHVWLMAATVEGLGAVRIASAVSLQQPWRVTVMDRLISNTRRLTTSYKRRGLAPLPAGPLLSPRLDASLYISCQYIYTHLMSIHVISYWCTCRDYKVGSIHVCPFSISSHSFSTHCLMLCLQERKTPKLYANVRRGTGSISCLCPTQDYLTTRTPCKLNS